MFVLIMAAFFTTDLGAGIHVGIGTLLFVLLVVHVIAHWRPFLALTKGYQKLSGKAKGNYVVIVLMILVWLFAMGLGIATSLSRGGMIGHIPNVSNVHGMVMIIATLLALVHICQQFNKETGYFKSKKKTVKH